MKVEKIPPINKIPPKFPPKFLEENKPNNKIEKNSKEFPDDTVDISKEAMEALRKSK